MVKTFEPYTNELTEFEKQQILPIIVKAWQRRSYDEYITMKQMIRATNTFLANKGIKNGKKIAKVNGPRMRKLIHHIRVNGLVDNLIADSKGYFKTKDFDKLQAFVDSLYQRSNSFRQVASSIKKYNQLT